MSEDVRDYRLDLSEDELALVLALVDDYGDGPVAESLMTHCTAAITRLPLDDLRDRAAQAALDAACYWDDAPDGVGSTGVTWDTANALWRENGYRIADAVLAALRDAGGAEMDQDATTCTK